MTIEEMKARKIELGLSNEMIAQLSGVPFSTVQKIFSGQTGAPRRRTIQALERAFAAAGDEPVRYGAGRSAQPAALREAAAPYQAKRKGEYTLEDYYAIPEERRVELIDGEIFDMSAPSAMHQIILGDLYLQFRQCADAQGHPCLVFLSPCDVRLDMDDKTMLQPDLFVLCREFDLSSRYIDGAPDLVVEILSPSTRSKDMLLKTYKYQHAGVREYWIVDPEGQKVLVYDFSREDLEPETWSFSDQIPVHISEGRCSIDFASIRMRMKL